MSHNDKAFFDGFADMLLQKQMTPASSLFAGESAKINAGIAVYRNNVRSSLSRALGDKFPVVQNLVGDDFFKFLAHEYFHSAPPSSPLVGQYGAALPDFLKTLEPARDFPYLADMARLEIYWLEAYHAAEATSLSAEEIVAKAGDDFATLAMQLHPSLRLLSSPYPVLSIWRRCKSGDTGEKLSAAYGEQALIVRPEREVEIHALSPAGFAAISALQQGGAIAEALAAGAAEDAAFEAQAFFQQLFQCRIVTGLTPVENRNSTS